MAFSCFCKILHLRSFTGFWIYGLGVAWFHLIAWYAVKLIWSNLLNQIILMRRNLSVVARYSLEFTRCLLLVVKPLVTRCKVRLLLIAEVVCCKKSLVTRCRSCSFQKITRYLLQNSLVSCCRSCSLQKCNRYSLQIRSLLVAEVAHSKKPHVARCKIRSLLVAEFAHYKKWLVTRCRSFS